VSAESLIILWPALKLFSVLVFGFVSGSLRNRLGVEEDAGRRISVGVGKYRKRGMMTPKQQQQILGFHTPRVRGTPLSRQGGMMASRVPKNGDDAKVRVVVRVRPYLDVELRSDDELVPCAEILKSWDGEDMLRISDKKTRSACLSVTILLVAGCVSFLFNWLLGVYSCLCLFVAIMLIKKCGCQFVLIKCIRKFVCVCTVQVLKCELH
jgi:hypothetical protein